MVSPPPPPDPSSDPSSRRFTPQITHPDLTSHESVNTDESLDVKAIGKIENLRPLLLLGSQSTRMGMPKHLLPWVDGRPVYLHLLAVLAATMRREGYAPEAGEGRGVVTVYVSARRGTAWGVEGAKAVEGVEVEIVYDDVGAGEDGDGDGEQERREANVSRGPAAGLLAAHALHPSATFLTVPIDHALLTPAALSHLLSSHPGPPSPSPSRSQLQPSQRVPLVTCFVNAAGFAELLIGIWSPAALEALRGNVARGAWGPSRVGARKRDTGEDKVSEGDLPILTEEEREQRWNKAFAALEGKVTDLAQAKTDSQSRRIALRSRRKSSGRQLLLLKFTPDQAEALPKRRIRVQL
ncbi:hypothetical protein B0A49_09843 [Cryomyces minteri]|uniref:Uncharacterized protein n=1 Tax=Cryomyces minteri TaxID=331657 RepID=A0A4U0WV74_9PEZI|nr:hypothetical protein B0A49_09455 [Cryomyces minteri]TKA66987.1 hypothetical protein B0A49_09843 [Cryomyces minteri]